VTISVGPTSVSFIKLRIESNYFFPESEWSRRESGTRCMRC